MDIPRNNDIKILQFADDLLIYHDFKNPLVANNKINNYLNVLVEYYKNWKLGINAGKSQMIINTGSKKTIDNRIIRFNKKVKNIKIDQNILKPSRDI